jgi:uncharacterized protein
MPVPECSLQVVYKIAATCNLDCTYCYVYNKGDDSWRRRPVIMSDGVFDAAVERTRQHCLWSGQTAVSVTFHGGEPTLAGVRRFDRWCKRIYEGLADIVRVKLCLQTNAILLDDEWAEVLSRHKVEVGVSVDGTPEIHDRFRVDHRGRGSYDKVLRGIEALKTAGIPLEILSVIPFGADGVEVHRHLIGLGSQSINYLLPDYTHDTIGPIRERFGKTPCSDFLIPIFDHWWFKQTTDVRISLFLTMARVILGGVSKQDLLGNHPLRFVFVETDGAIEALDVLRVCQPGITGTGLNVLRDDFRQIADVSPLHRRTIFTGMPLATKCQGCVERDTCGGGYLPHRYSQRRAFDNPSVWCADLLRMFAHIRRRLEVDAEETALRRQALGDLAKSELPAEASKTPPRPVFERI